jgi:hypothetical protein
LVLPNSQATGGRRGAIELTIRKQHTLKTASPLAVFLSAIFAIESNVGTDGSQRGVSFKTPTASRK